MKKTFTRQLALLVFFCFTSLFAQAQQNLVDIPDNNFRNVLKTYFPYAFVGDQMDANNELVRGTLGLDIFSGQSISNLEGIQYFTSIERLDCSNNNIIYFPQLPNSITTLDVSNNYLTSLPLLPNSLHYLKCNDNNIQYIYQYQLPSSLYSIECKKNSLTLLHIDSNILLDKIDCSYNQLTSLPTLPNTLTVLYCNDNKLTNLVTLPSTLTKFSCENNQLTSLPTLPNTLTLLSCGLNKLTSLPILPSTLTELTCEGNQLTSLPALPSTLTKLYCFRNQLTSLPTLPSTLGLLYCDGNQLKTIPTLPSTLTELSCGGNQLTSPLALPNTLTKLSCGGNQLTSLPALPSTLTVLYCFSNQITSLPTLPSTLRLLYCDSNQLKTIPTLPSTLTELSCRSNQITSLPTLPSKLGILYISSNTIKCLPFLPNTLSRLIADDNLCLPNLPNNTFTYKDGSYYNLPKTLCSEIYNPNNCTVYQRATGRVYIDVNTNHTFDKDIDYPYAHANINASPYTTATDTAGNYDITFENLNKNYTITPTIPVNFTASPASYIVNFPSNNMVLSGKDFILTPTQTVNDLTIQLTDLARPRPGFVTSYIVTVKNNGTTLQNTNVSYTFDNHLVYASSIPSGTLSSNILSWTLPNFKPFEERSFTVSFTLPANVAIGTSLSGTATVSPLANDNTPSDNTYILAQTVRGSFDPNDKSSNRGISITPDQVANQNVFEYLVRFQNTGNDTAFTVVIKDTISTLFDLNTLQTVSASHNYSFKMKNNVAYWTFDNINLPDSITNKAGSNGFVKYSIKPLTSSTAAGLDFKNTAYIGFDFNADVKTNTTSTIVSTITGISPEELASRQVFVYPNPSKGIFTIELPNNTQTTSLEVYSAEGRLVQTSSTTENQTIINLSSQNTGIYFLKIKGADFNDVKKLILE